MIENQHTEDTSGARESARREWHAPVLTTEDAARITQSGKASNVTEVNGPPNFGPPS